MTARKPATLVPGNVRSVDHAASSRNGNPTYRITLTDGRTFLTETDGGIGYAAPNFRPHSLRLPVSPVILSVGARGRVVDIARPDGFTEDAPVDDLWRLTTAWHDTADDPHPLAEDVTGDHPGVCLTCGHPVYS